MADKPMCCEKVPGHKGGLRTWPCQNYGKVQVDGKWYCGFHDPEKVKQRREASDARFNAQMDAMHRRSCIAKLKEEVVEAAKSARLGQPTGTMWTKVDELIAAEKECEP